MAELRRVFALPGVGPVRAPSGEKPRRFVSDGRGGGYWTYQTVEEEAAEAAAAKAQHDARVAQTLQWHPSIAGQRQAEREAEKLAAWNAQWPDPRAQLRDAHQRLREIEETLVQARDHAAAAATHTARCQGEVERCEAVLAAVRKQAAGLLKARLVSNDDAPPDAEDPVEPATLALDRARRAFDVATVAQADLDHVVQQTQAEIARAKARVEECALAVIAQAERVCREELSAVEARGETLRNRLAGLRIDTRWGSGNWPAAARALLSDPAALLPGEEPKLQDDAETSLNEVEPVTETV
jgi:hypothetical protein